MSIQSQTGSLSYSPLSPAGNEIRLFLLNPGDHNERISGRLQHVSLHDDIQYTALSYAWGDPNVTRPITLNGHSFDVTTNLKSALLQLRHRTQLRSLWIDAICIYPDRHRTKCCRNLRFEPQFCEGFGFASHCLDSNPQKPVRAPFGSRLQLLTAPQHVSAKPVAWKLRILLSAR
jgi:hypothetical protein